MTFDRVSFADVLRVREFRWLWLAGVQSHVGDQLARVALSVLIFEQTGSVIQTALVYALTFVPTVLGAVTLSWLADRLPRRSVMIVCDIARASLLALMALPHLSMVPLSGLLVVAVLVGVPFSTAQLALLPDILGERRYLMGSGLRMLTDQLAQVLGFALGGAAVAAVGTRRALLIDAVSFALSAAIISVAVQRRPPPLVEEADDRGNGAGVWATAQKIFADAQLRALLLFGWLAGCFIIPEALAAPYARSTGAGATGTGLLMASIPAGGALGAWILLRLVPERSRTHLLSPLAILAGLPLIGCWWHPNLGISALLWGISGAASAYQVIAAAMFVRGVPDHRRGRAVGLAASGLVAIQGIGALVGGLAGEHFGINRAVAIAGIVGTVMAVLASFAWHRAQARSGPRWTAGSDSQRAGGVPVSPRRAAVDG